MKRRKQVRRPSSPSRKREIVSFGPLTDFLGFHLRLAQEIAFQSFSSLSRDVGEKPGRYATLMLISQNPDISQTHLSQAAGRNKSSMTPVLDVLVRQGLIKRQRRSGDRRSYSLRLTPAGERTLARIHRYALQHERQLDRIVGRRDKDRVLQALKRVLRALS